MIIYLALNHDHLFSFMRCALLSIACPSVLYLLAIALPVRLRYMASDCPFWYIQTYLNRQYYKAEITHCALSTVICALCSVSLSQ